MKAVKRWRYYCDYCKKSGGSKHHMEDHERSCTMNPNRDCSMCLYTGGFDSGLAEMVAIIKSRITSFESDYGYEVWKIADGETEGSIIAKIRDISGCPACILAAIRQSGVPFLFESFNYKKERDDVWKEVNIEKRAAVLGW